MHLKQAADKHLAHQYANFVRIVPLPMSDRDPPAISRRLTFSCSD